MKSGKAVHVSRAVAWMALSEQDAWQCFRREAEAAVYSLILLLFLIS
jgi:hypothetical protein